MLSRTGHHPSKSARKPDERLDCGAKFKTQSLGARGLLGGDGAVDLRDA